MVGAGIDVGGAAVLSGGVGLVEAAEALLGFGEVAVVEGVRVHLHEQDHGVQE